MKLIGKDSGILGCGQGIAYVDGKYYLLSENPAKVCVSKNLENWTEYKLNDDYLKPKNIVYGNGIFIITGESSTSTDTWFYRSTDGVNWTPIKINTGETYGITSNSVKFINNRFVALLGIYWYRMIDGKKIKTENWFYESTNGINWTKHQLIVESSEDLAHMDIDFYNGTYVRVGETGSIFTSTDLDNWIRRVSGTSVKLVGIAYGKGQFVVTGDKGTILTSTNGINWAKQETGTDAYLIRSRYANGMYIACGYNGTILQSIDGVLWSDIDNGSEGVRYGLAYNNENNVIVITAYRYKETGTIPIYILNLSRELTADDDSSLFFFNKELNLLGVVDYFTSLRWRRKYFEAGEFEIVLPINDYMMQFIDTDVIVMRNNYTEAGIIETIEFSDNGTNEEVTISGRFLTSLLSRRIVKNKINFSGNTIEGMNTIVNAMTPLTPQWETETVTMSSPHIDFQVTYKNVYDYLCKLSEYSNIGIRIVPNIDSKVYMFEVWKGLDRTSGQTENEEYSFSDDNYNIEQGKLVKSEKTKANYILVGGTGEEDNRVLVTVDAGKTGFDLYEVFSDQKSLSNKDLSDSVYRAKLKSIGEGKVSDGAFQLEVTALVQQDYKVKWDLGDVVNIKKEKWGVCTTYRIIEVEETIEDGKKTIYPTFGNPLSSAWDEE